MAEKLKVAIVGTGGIARGAHVPGWAKLSDKVELWALCDINPAAVEACANELACNYGIEIPPERRYTDYNKMFRDVEAGKLELDIVDVCTPNVYHVEPTVRAFRAGCHVIVEKPMATSAREAEKMIAAEKEAGKLLMVAQSMRFTPEGLLMKDIADAGALGEIYWGEAILLRPRGVPSWGAFISKEASAGGPVYDLAVHVLDLTFHLMGFPDPVAVSAGTYLKISDKPSVMKHDYTKYTVPEDFAAALIRLEGGITVSLETSWALDIPGGEHQVRVCGDKGGIQMNPLTLVREEFGALTNTTIQVNPYAGIQSHHEEIRRFVEAILTGGPSPVPGEQALKTQKVLDAIYKSGETGKEVRIK
ncbi:MAG: Gfo/Idh/MocA family oxidoreductase [Armatimonadetes bacterium]|nr:Gfo/Idh/MocA family oxidoreductase [Armatimonadota bacterium]